MTLPILFGGIPKPVQTPALIVFELVNPLANLLKGRGKLGLGLWVPGK